MSKLKFLINKAHIKSKKYAKSFIINDPNGELLLKSGQELNKMGYKIRILNFANPKHSNSYNPFYYIRDNDDIFRMVNVLLKYTTPILSSNKHWESVEHNLLSSLCLYLYYEAPPDEQNFSMIMELLRAANTKNGVQSDLDRLYKLLERRDVNHIALQKYNIYKHEQQEYYSSDEPNKPKLLLRDRLLEANHQSDFVANSIYKRIEIFNRRSIAAITIVDNINFENFYNEKSALFITIPKKYEELTFILVLLYSQIIKATQQKNKYYKGVSLPLYIVDNYRNVTFSAEIITSMNETSKNTDESIHHIILMNRNDFTKMFKYSSKQNDYNVENIKTPYDTLDAFFKEFM